MRVSIDGILGSAQQINNQRQLDENNQQNKKDSVRTDSVSITNRVNTRIDFIENEFREIQSSLTRNQIVRDGINQLQDDLNGGGQNQQAILGNVQFEQEPVLQNFVGSEINEQTLTTQSERNLELINTDINRLKRLQVEMENIVASNLAGDERAGSLMENLETAFNDTNAGNLESISSLQPDSVMRLIR